MLLGDDQQHNSSAAVGQSIRFRMFVIKSSICDVGGVDQCAEHGSCVLLSEELSLRGGSVCRGRHHQGQQQQRPRHAYKKGPNGPGGLGPDLPARLASTSSIDDADA